jgi:hypothetical protein
MLAPLLQRLRSGADRIEIGEFLRHELEDLRSRPSGAAARRNGRPSDRLVDVDRPG